MRFTARVRGEAHKIRAAADRRGPASLRGGDDQFGEDGAVVGAGDAEDGHPW